MIINERRFRRVGTAAAAAAALVLVAACASTSSTKPVAKSGTTAPKAADTGLFPAAEVNKPQRSGTPLAGGSLSFGLESAVATLVPGDIQQPADQTVGLAVYDPIVGFDSQGAAAPNSLAAAWKSSPDLKTWTFTLRSGIRFSDGTPADAGAVVAQVKAQKAIPTCGCAADVTHIVAVSAPSATTVVFTLDQSNVAFPVTLAGSTGYLASPASWAAGPVAMTRNPVGTGPFKLLAPGKLDFVRNPYYWRKDPGGRTLPHLDKISFVPLPDSATRLASLRSGRVDIFQTADTKNLVQAKKDTRLSVQPVTGTSSTILVLNSHKPPFDDLRLRQAVNYAIDRELINRSYYENTRQPAYGPILPGTYYYDPEGQLPHTDAARAKALVAQLEREGKPTTFTSMCISTPEATSIYAVMKKLLANVGITLKLQSVDQVALVNELLKRDGKFESSCFRSGQFSDPDDLYSSYYRTAGNNISLYNNLDADEALREGRKSADPARRRTAYFRFQKDLAKDVVVIPLLFDLYGNVHSLHVSGLATPRPNSLGLISPGDLYRVAG